MKIIREHINEVLNFKRDQEDSLASYGVGQIHLIKSWLDEMGVKNYTINNDFTIDVKGHVYLDFKNLTKFPNYIKFNKVDKSFYCSNNQLTSLEGCPTSVGRNFFCYDNQLTNLEGCPTSIGGNFSCSHNQLTSLEGCPTSVSGYFSCSNNKIKFNKKDVEKLCDADKIYV